MSVTPEEGRRRSRRRGLWLFFVIAALVAAALAAGLLMFGVFDSSTSPSSLGGGPTTETTPGGKPLTPPTVTLPGKNAQGGVSVGVSAPPATDSNGGSSSPASDNGNRVAQSAGTPAPPPGLIGPGLPARPTFIYTQGDPSFSSSLGQELGTLAWGTQTSGTSNRLNSVDAIDNTHVWAAGANCTILYSANGTTWAQDTHVPAGCSAALTGIHVQGPGGPGYAVGANGTVLVCASACNAVTAVWSKLTPGSVASAKDGTLTNASAAAQSNSLFATNAYVGWTITAASGKIPASTTILSVNTSTKTATLSHAATGAVTKDTFTVTAPASVLPPANVDFTAVWAADATHVYASGTTAGGAGSIWACSAACNSTSSIPSGPAGPPAPPPPPAGTANWADITPAGLATTALNGIEGQGPGLVLAVGSKGTILVCKTNCATSGAGWAKVVAGAQAPAASVTFNSIWASDPTHVYAVGTSGGSGVIWACSDKCDQSTTGLAKVPSPPDPGPPGPPPPPPPAGSAWAKLVPTQPLPNLNSVTGTGPDTAWAAGDNGAIWYCPKACATEPTSWVEVSPPHPTSTTLNGVAVSDPNHAWAVGNAGTIVAFVGNPTEDAISKAIADLAVALNANLWSSTNNDGNHVDDDKGGQVFDNAREAAKELMKIGTGPPPPGALPAWAVTDLTYLDYAARLIATNAIADNSCGTPKQKELDTANDEIAKGDAEYVKGHYDAAIDHYKHAWEHALKALGQGCPGLGVTPTGAPTFSIVKMVPLDTSTISGITVQNTGTVAPELDIYEQNLVGALLPALHLKIVMDGTTTVYDGALNGLGNAASPTHLPGNLGGGAWAAGEQHTFKFIVSFPTHGAADNAYQGASGSLNFVWART